MFRQFGTLPLFKLTDSKDSLQIEPNECIGNVTNVTFTNVAHVCCVLENPSHQ